MAGLKILSFLYPYLREMILGEKTLREAVKTNKTRVGLMILIMLSFLFNILFLPKLFRISTDYVLLNHKYENLQQQCPTPTADGAPPPPPPPVKEVLHPAETKPPAPAHETSANAGTPNDTPKPLQDIINQNTQQFARKSLPGSPTAKSPTRLHNGPERAQQWEKSFDIIQDQEQKNPNSTSH